jgi:hypothetical protein
VKFLRFLFVPMKDLHFVAHLGLRRVSKGLTTAERERVVTACARMLAPATAIALAPFACSGLKTSEPALPGDAGAEAASEGGVEADGAVLSSESFSSCKERISGASVKSHTPK